MTVADSKSVNTRYQLEFGSPTGLEVASQSLNKVIIKRDLDMIKDF